MFGSAAKAGTEKLISNAIHKTADKTLFNETPPSKV
jgi:hypothetical protein